MLPREFHRRCQAVAGRAVREDEAAWSRALLITNHVRSALGADDLTLDDLRASGDAPEPPTPADVDALWAQLDAKRDARRGRNRPSNIP